MRWLICSVAVDPVDSSIRLGVLAAFAPDKSFLRNLRTDTELLIHSVIEHRTLEILVVEYYPKKDLRDPH